jgi:biopolymer transport protein ExbD
MAGGGGGVGGKRDVNAELNLVPYIDLLSTLICFLLLTAVYNQIASISTNASDATASESATPLDPNRVDLSVSVFLDRIEAKIGAEVIPIPHRGDDIDKTSLLKVLTNIKNRFPDRKDITLNSDSQAQYKLLISTMDTLAEADFPDIGVNTQ